MWHVATMKPLKTKFAVLSRKLGRQMFDNYSRKQNMTIQLNSNPEFSDVRVLSPDQCLCGV